MKDIGIWIHPLSFHLFYKNSLKVVSSTLSKHTVSSLNLVTPLLNI